MVEHEERGFESWRIEVAAQPAALACNVILAIDRMPGHSGKP